MSKELLQKNIEEFEEKVCEEMDWSQEKDGGWVGDLYYLAEDVKEKTKKFLIQSHISMLEEEIERLKGKYNQIYESESRNVVVDGEKIFDIFAMGQLNIIQDIISHKEKELVELKELLK